MKFVFVFAAMGSFVGLGACTGSTNPEEATVIDNIINLESGEYDRQISANQAQAKAILANNRAAQNRISSLESQKSANAQMISALRSEIEATKAAARQARAKAGSDASAVQRISLLEGQIRSVEGEVNSGVADPSIARSELRRIRSALASI